MRSSDWSSDVCSSDLLDHLHAVMLRRRGLLADIGHAGETGLVPDRHAIAIAHQMLRQFALAEVAAVGVERNALVVPGARAEPACRLAHLVLRLDGHDPTPRPARHPRALPPHRTPHP